MEIKREYIIKNPSYSKPVIMKNVDSLILHSTGDAVSGARAHIQYYNNTLRNVSVHGFIDADTGEVFETLPHNYRGAHAGAGGMNSHSIGIEMCEPTGFKYSGGATIGIVTDMERCIEGVKRTYKTAVEYVAHLIVDEEVPITHIYGHGELRKLGLSTTTHVDPEHLWKRFTPELTMDRFRKDVGIMVERRRIEKMEERYRELMEIPEVYRETVKKLIDSGVVKGYADGTLDLSKDMCRMLTMLDRAGIFDE